MCPAELRPLWLWLLLWLCATCPNAAQIAGNALGFQKDLSAKLVDGTGVSLSLPAGSLGNQVSTDSKPRTLTLKEAVNNAAGPERSIIVCSTSEPYLDFTENWYTSVAKFNYGSRVVFIAEDRASYKYLSSKWPLQTVLVDEDDGQLESNLEGSQPRLRDRKAAWGSKYYKLIVMRRPTYFRALLDLNVTFLYNDVDIVWLKDVYPFLTGDFDVWAQQDARINPYMKNKKKVRRWRLQEICTGFMLVRPTEGSRALVDGWSTVLREHAARSEGLAHNQKPFNLAMKETRGKVRIGVLPTFTFPTGLWFFPPEPKSGKKSRRRRNPLVDRGKSAYFWNEAKSCKCGPAIVHNNFAEGHKVKLRRFKEAKLWFLPDDFAVTNK